MNEDTTPTAIPPTPTDPQPGAAGPPPKPRRLTKSESDKKIGGVAAGVADYFGIDPTIVRLLFLASIFLGGFGIIAYLIAWIVLPTDDGSNTRAAPHTLASTSSTLVAVGLLVAGAIVAAVTLDNPFGGSFLVPLFLIGAGAFLLLQQPDGEAPNSTTPLVEPGSASVPAPPPPTSPRTAIAVRPTAAVPATATTASVELVSPSGVARSEPPPPPGPGESSPPITALVFSVLALIGASGFLVHAAGWADVSPTVVVATGLGAIGIGLVTAAFLGGGRWLIPLGILTTFVLMISAVISPAFDDGVGERDYRPETFADVRDEYRHGMGEMRIDLRDVTFPDGDHTVEAHLGIGEMVMIVPDDVQLDVSGSLDIGELEVLGEIQNGITNDVEVSDTEVDSDVLLVVEVDAGIGHVVVRTESGGDR